MVINEIPPPPRNGHTKTILISLGLILVLGFAGYGFYVSHYEIVKVTAPPTTSTPSPTPKPIADVTLSPNNQVVVLSLYHQPNFNLTITQNGYGNVTFPCSVTMISSLPDVYHSTSTQEYWTLTGYGTRENGIIAWVPVAPQAETVSYYAVIQDSTGTKITSNTVTVDYK